MNSTLLGWSYWHQALLGDFLPPTQRTWWLPSTMSKLVKRYTINLQCCSLASVISPAIWLSHLDRWSFQKPCKHSNALGKTSGVRSKPWEQHWMWTPDWKPSQLACMHLWSLTFSKFLTQSACWAKNGGQYGIPLCYYTSILQDCPSSSFAASSGS